MEFLSKEDIIFKVIDDLEKSENLLTFKSQLKTDLIGYHHSMGQWIRNNFKLWHPENPLTKDKHPDDLSYEIIVAVWEHFNT